MKIKRKPKKVELRGLNGDEMERAILARISNYADGYTRKQILNALDDKGKSEALKVCKTICSNGGSSSKGLQVHGKKDGVHVLVSTEGENVQRLAEGIIPYTQVLEYVINNREVKKCAVLPKQRKKIVKRK